MLPLTFPSRGIRYVLALGIFLAALNMRAPVIAVPPLLDTIRVDTGLSSSVAGLIITLPMVCFALFSLGAPQLARRAGLDWAVIGAMVLVAVGSLLRTASPVAALFTGTVVIGAGIAIGNVLVPALIKRDFPHSTGVMMAVYGLGMSIGGTLAAALVVPVQDWFGFG